MTPEQLEALKTAVDGFEAWARGALNACMVVRQLVEQAGAVSTVPKDQPKLTPSQCAEILAKRKQRMLKRKS